MFTKKQARLLFHGLTITLFVACGGRSLDNTTSSGITGTGSSSTAPTVTALSPADNATGVYTDQALKATFSTTIDTATVTLSSNTDCTGSFLVATTSVFNNGDCLAMQQSVSQSGTEITVRPAALLSASTPYYVRITTAVKSTGGATMQTVYNSQFTTGTGISPLTGEFGTDCSAGADTLATVRTAIPDPEAAIGPYVVKQLVVTAIDKDGYFYVQAGATGPAVFVRDTAHKASGLGLQVGDEICLTISKGYKYNELQQATQIDAIKKTNGAQSYPAQSISGAVNNDDYEAELVNIAGTLTTKSTTDSGGGFNHILTYGAETIMLREMTGSGKLDNFVQGQSIEVATVMSQYNATYQLYIDSTVGSVAEYTGGTFNVTGASASGATQAKLTFNNTPDAAAAVVTNYSANNGLTISAVSISGVTATLTTSAQTPGTSYTITVANAKRGADNAALTTNTAAFTGFVPPVPPASFTTGQIVINEVNAAPSGASKEYIELYNTTASAISLNGATLWYKSAGGLPNQSVTLTGTIPANGYYTILSATTACAGATQTGLGGITGLANTAGAVVLTVDGIKPTTTADTNLRDVAQWGANSPDDWSEGGNTGPVPSVNKTVARAPNGVDTNNNGNDFILSTAADGTCGAANWTGDAVAPTVASTIPASGAVGVAVSSTLSATFSEPMYVATVSTANFYLVQGTDCNATKITGTISASSGNTKFSFASGTLSASTQYSLCVKAAVQDVALNLKGSDTVSSFTTAAPDVTPPTVASANPASGATGVSLNPTVSVTFDEAMDTATINGAFTVRETNCSGTVKSSGTPTASNGDKTFTYSLSSLSTTTVYATCMGTGAKDVAGNALSSPYSITWTTGAGGGETLIYSQDFETCAKSAYASNPTTSCSGAGQWNLNDAVIGSLANDLKNGTKSIRARNPGTATMNFDVAGAKRVKFYYGKYTGDANTALQLQASTNGGSTWVNEGSAITVSNTSLLQADIVVSYVGSVRFQILKTDGTTARANIDDFEIYN